MDVSLLQFKSFIHSSCHQSEIRFINNYMDMALMHQQIEKSQHLQPTSHQYHQQTPEES